MFIVGRKATEGTKRSWLFWSDGAWVAERTKATAFPSRDEALKTHEKLRTAQAWPAGGNPLVLDRK